jgi:phosphate/sulfate permease
MDFFTVLLVILFVAAIIDLVVGVSNDAVNFLNSAIGSRVAPLPVILLVASIGIIMGSTFSSGMMEVARNGLFNPAFFTFEQVMFIFLVVLLTDIILLDFFNSLGLPTSTTVSLVFEILGAAFAVGILHSYSQGLTWDTINLTSILNFSSAITIVSGIFLSILFAFVLGSIIQRITRTVFTFSLKETMKKYGAIFCGIAISVIIYFLIIKGVKGSSLISEDQVKWVLTNSLPIVLATLVFFSIIIQLIMWYTSINPLRVVVLLGTFSLAMAFAGNDLVNFIGVAMGGLVSYQKWSASGIPADQFQMGILTEKLITPTWILVIAGLIMVVTLWTNAKSRKVSRTELSLSRQDEGDEIFRPNWVSRILVRFAIYLGRMIDILLPRKWSLSLEKRFAKHDIEVIPETDQPMYDLVRASVNLLVASILIAYGTSQKLPLSTTFVTFMVAMGSSFADQAWGRESAVYRVAGVMNVIAGWLVTAMIAFTFSALIALIIFKTGITGIIAVTTIAGFLLIRSHVLFARNEKKEASSGQVFSNNLKNLQQAIDESKEVTVKNLKMISKVYSTSIESLAKEKLTAVEKSMEKVKELRLQNEKVQHKIIKYVKKMPKQNLAASRLYILMFDNIQDLYQSALLISESCTNHLRNFHSSPSKEYLTKLGEVDKALQVYLILVCDSIESGKFKNFDDVTLKFEKLQLFINQSVDQQITVIQKGNVGNRIGMLQMRLLLETKDILNTLQNIYQLYNDYQKQE